MTASDPKIIAIHFNDYINRRDIDGLTNLMTDDYTFIDSAGTVRSGKETGVKDWLSFFGMFPDYKNIFETFTFKDDLLIITGYSSCSDPRLAGPAIWTAKTVSGKVSEWRVYEDTGENRESLLNLADK